MGKLYLVDLAGSENISRSGLCLFRVDLPASIHSQQLVQESPSSPTWLV